MPPAPAEPTKQPGLVHKGHLALYPGSFDPITYGHLDVIRRGRRLFDRVVVAIGRNPGKDPLFTVDERLSMVRTLIDEMVKAEPDAAPVTVEAFSGLTVDFANQISASALLRGIRNLSDLQSEVQQALTNREVANLETVFILAGHDFAYTSSSLIRQITAMGKDMMALASMVPATVIEQLRQKKAEHHPALERLLAREEES